MTNIDRDRRQTYGKKIVVDERQKGTVAKKDFMNEDRRVLPTQPSTVQNDTGDDVLPTQAETDQGDMGDLVIA